MITRIALVTWGVVAVILMSSSTHGVPIDISVYLPQIDHYRMRARKARKMCTVIMKERGRIYEHEGGANGILDIEISIDITLHLLIR
jgi:hypothetical protein